MKDGSSFFDILFKAKEHALTIYSQITFKFNDISISINSDSDSYLIFRDYIRAQSGYIEKNIGPYPKEVLSEKELLNEHELMVEIKEYLQRSLEIANREMSLN